MMTKTGKALAAGCCALLLAGCGGEPSDEPQSTTASPYGGEAGGSEAPAASQEPIGHLVEIEAGTIAGTVIGDPEDPVHIYRGVPYAAPPVGDLRWRPPQPVEPWDGIREATEFGDWAAQPYPTPSVFEVATEDDISEDTLHLNVLTPAERADEQLPVMVWLHGGGLDILSGNMSRYNTPPLPQEGAVVVTVSHRLGPFGYLAHPWLSEESENGVSGNYGQMDQIAALEWVQSNISAFGGDPDRVTIFGQSGGGRKVNFLMASPTVPDGLFHRAISQSSSIRSMPLEEAEQNGVALTDELGVENLAELRETPWQEVIAAAQEIDYSGELVQNGHSLLEPIPQSFADGDQKDVPYMIGMVETEDAGHFHVPVDLLPDMQQHSSPVFAYTFTAVPSGWREDGVTGWHAIDMAYVFGTLDQAFVDVKPQYFAAYPEPRGAEDMDPGITDADRELARNIKRMWTEFAATGDPSIEGVVDWPAYTPEADQYLQIDLPLEVRSGYSELRHFSETE